MYVTCPLFHAQRINHFHLVVSVHQPPWQKGPSEALDLKVRNCPDTVCLVRPLSRLILMVTTNDSNADRKHSLTSNQSKTQILRQTTTESWGQENQALGWYNEWLALQFDSLPNDIFNIFPTRKDDGQENTGPERKWQPLISAFLRIEECIISTPSITIDQIILQLLDEGFLIVESVDNTTSSEQNFQYAQYFIFCALGWQTMLFTPASPSNNSITWEAPRLAINEQDGCCGYTHMSLEQDSRACSRESLSEFLMGFGVLLPSKNMCLDDDPNIQQAFHQQTEVYPKGFNAYTLNAVAGLRIKWVDALACHLEFNSTTKEISLFRFPSFCQSMLLRSTKVGRPGVIHTCATTSHLRCQWATEDEINQLLVEILLSYRLLFGQTRKSRAFFRSSVNPFTRKSNASRDNIRDPLLLALCGTKTPCHSILNGLVEKDTYYLLRDFTILRYRISVLQRNLSSTAPRTWVQLWRDNRDSASWLTFWAVIIFGAFGCFMSFLQVILQFVQLFLQ